MPENTLLDNLKIKLDRAHLHYVSLSKDKIGVYYKCTKTYFCHAELVIETHTGRYGETTNLGHLRLTWVDPFESYPAGKFLISQDAFAKIKSTMDEPKALKCWEDYAGVGLYTNSPEMREVLDDFRDKYITDFRWIYNYPNRIIWVMNSDDKVVSCIEWDKEHKWYKVKFYTPFLVGCRYCINSDNYIKLSKAECVGLAIKDVIYYYTKTITGEPRRGEAIKMVNKIEKHEMLDKVYNEITTLRTKDGDCYLKLTNLFIANNGIYRNKYITIRDTNTGDLIGEVYGLFDPNGGAETLLGINYVNHNTWLACSVGEGVDFIKAVTRMFSEKRCQKEAAEPEDVCVVSARHNGKTAYVFDQLYGRFFRRFNIKDVIFQDPATIVFWEDNTKTVVKTQNGEEFDPEKGLAMAIAKKLYGNDRGYYKPFLKWIGKYNKKKFKKAVEEALKVTPDEIIHDGHRYVLVNTPIAEAKTEDEKDAEREKLMKEIADMTQTQHKQGGIPENEV